jgi:hypothetical protein
MVKVFYVIKDVLSVQDLNDVCMTNFLSTRRSLCCRGVQSKGKFFEISISTSPLGCPFSLAVFYSNLHVWHSIYVLIRPLHHTLTSDWLSPIRSPPSLTSQVDDKNLTINSYPWRILDRSILLSGIFSPIPCCNISTVGGPAFKWNTILYTPGVINVLNHATLTDYEKYNVYLFKTTEHSIPWTRLFEM